MFVYDEEQYHQDKGHIDLEAEIELDHVRKEDNVEELHLQAISYFLAIGTGTIISPSIVSWKNIATNSLKQEIAEAKITL